uniref:NADH dehydrogenase subunit 5 n=1 Tax=Hygrobates turcicus TaxID=2028090 RepID=UPI00223829E1|nr:NADH dehydrogenase subunit 5 [Hygrobates turcicus]UYS90926.1 NADH dehydrogenase subunit 5 [Hygrobates turcicus]
MFFLSFFFSSYGSGFILNFSFNFWDSYNYDFIFIMDFLSLSFSCFVFLISSVVFSYSNFYLMGDKTLLRFFFTLLLFVSSMMLLVFSFNFFAIMLGWDGLGMSSFFLVVFYSNSSSLVSGVLTVLSNRLGDLAMLLTFYFMFSSGSWSVFSLLVQASNLMMFFIIFAAMTKSAQFPFSAWLPAAMAAPTPVSSLVHSSTLVTAGVYLLIRFYYTMILTYTSIFFCCISLVTMFCSGALAVFECDLKKIVAMSTLSQLGFMMFALSLGEWMLSFFHMVCHALYKSLLFLSSGVFISYSLGGQDLRGKGNLCIISPFFFIIFIFSSLSLVGFPFLSGFFSKDFLLEFSVLGGWFNFFSVFFLFSCSFSLVYSIRILIVGLMSYSNFSPFFSFDIFSSSVLPMFFLFCWSLLFGFLFSNLVFIESFFYVFSNFKLIPIVVLFSSIFIYFSFFNFKIANNFKLAFSDYFFLYWFSSSFLSKLMGDSNSLSNYDLLWVEFLGPKIVGKVSFLSVYSIMFMKYFYKIIYLFMGMIFLLFIFLSFL